MMTRPIEQVAFHRDDMALRGVCASYCRSVQGWVIIADVTTTRGNRGFMVGQNGQPTVYPCISTVADTLAQIKIATFSVTQPVALEVAA
jgi:hypothetical protein